MKLKIRLKCNCGHIMDGHNINQFICKDCNHRRYNLLYCHMYYKEVYMFGTEAEFLKTSFLKGHD